MKSFTQSAVAPLFIYWFATSIVVVFSRNHPLLNDPQLPPDFDKRNVLMSQCSYYQTDKYDYTNFTRLCEIDNINPTGFLVRMPLYIQGGSDALVQFSQRMNPGPSASVYEFLLGNEQIVISRKKGYETLAEIPIDDSIAEEQPTKFVLEITTDGHIRVFSELDKANPLLEAHDPKPLRIKYVSFTIYEPSKAEFFFNCQF